MQCLLKYSMKGEFVVVNIFACSDKGCLLAKKIAGNFDNVTCYTTDKFAHKYDLLATSSIKTTVGQVFCESSLIIFVGACGIAVRMIAPFIKSKTTDPACIAVDDCGNFVIPILSGHIGGANQYAEDISKLVNGVAVITTATDINGKFSVDSFAANQGLFLDNMDLAKEFSATILKENLPIYFDDNILVKGNIPNSLYNSSEGKIGCYVGYKNFSVFENTLKLVAKVLTVGIGCRKDTPAQNIEKLFLDVFTKYNLDKSAVKKICSIDIKKEEQGLLEFADKYSYSTEFYSSQQLSRVIGEFTASSFVKSVTGVDNVCERSAIFGSENGKIIVNKTSENGVTIAVSLEEKEICFE